MTPETLILLANLGRPRRPAGASAPHSEPALPDPTAAGEQLAPLISGPVTEADLPALRRVHRLAVEGAESLLSGEPPDCAAITALAHGSTAHVELTATDGGLRQDLVWSDDSIAAGLARRLIGEFAALEPNRLRRCARTACDLVFYDTTRSRTRRWHAEDPCGWRERQHHRRTRS
ncbi:MAG TPA: CGNR zinc finger domain-containing protein [Acidimicrobiales bacterium]|nr:CGNR zinc finger domain-containing protein [Acidimicrobiales bacterium]